VAAGYGLLKRKTWAYWLTVGYFGFGLVNFVVFYATPGTQKTAGELIRKTIPQGMSSDVPQLSALEGALIGLLTMGLPLYFLLTRKKRYFAACRASTPVPPAASQE